jgi:hypothetical protein
MPDVRDFRAWECPNNPAHATRVLEDEDRSWLPDERPVRICGDCGCDAVPFDAGRALRARLRESVPPPSRTAIDADLSAPRARVIIGHAIRDGIVAAVIFVAALVAVLALLS